MTQRNLVAIGCSALFFGQLVATYWAAGLFLTPGAGFEAAAIGSDLRTTAYAYIANLPLAATCLFLSIIWFRKIDGISKAVPIALAAFSFAMVIPLGHLIVLVGLPIAR